jgi:hypothetical protein
MVPAAGYGHILQPGSPEAADEKRSDRQPEETERAFPFRAVHSLHISVEELEDPGQGHADAAEEPRKPRLRRLAERVVERRAGGDGFEHGSELDLLLDALERVRAFLQPFGYGQVPGLDDVADVGLRGGLPDEQQLVDGVVDEIEVARDIVPVNADAACGTEEALELGKPITGMTCLLTSLMP